MASDKSEKSPLGLYIHWPFCVSKCPYCDFNSHLQQAVDSEDWRAAYRTELQTLASRLVEQTGKDYVWSSLFIGGGTPSLMPDGLMAGLLDDIATVFDLPDEVEITAECNPGSAELSKLKEFRQAGVNRLSIGVQSLSQKGLQHLGRAHSADEALRALDEAERLYDRFSADFIYGWQGQHLEDWHSELEQIVKMGLAHLSCYQLTIETGTIFHTRTRRGETLVVTADEMADFLTLTENYLNAAGLPSYEVSNYAATDQACQHNLTYWQAGDWLAIGPGGHGRAAIGNQRWHMQTRRAPNGWLEQVQTQHHGLDIDQMESKTEFGLEALMMGLRLTQGVDLKGPVRHLALDETRLGYALDEGWLEQDGSFLKTSFEGRMRLIGLIDYLIPND